MPALYVSDYGEGITHPINSYTLKPNVAVPNGAWMLLATNDQTTFARIDAREDVTFSAGETRQYDVENSASYRWYYLYLQEGFSAGNNLEFHLDELSPPPSPTPSHTHGVDIVIERVPLVVIADFDGKAMKLQYYTFTSSATLPEGQSWQLFGTNDPGILGSNNFGAFTLLDSQSGIGFVGGVPQQFNVTPSTDFLYYVFYLESGFSVRGMNLEIQFHESQAGPTPTPTTTPTPTVSPTVTPTTPTPPVADFEGTPRAGYVPFQVTFTDLSTGTISNWSWDFGDGSTSSEQNPNHIYLSPGWYAVNLTICNDDGCFWHSRGNYIYTVVPETPTPRETPRYYIRIGDDSSGSSGADTGGEGSTPDSGKSSSPEIQENPVVVETEIPMTEEPTPTQPTPTPTVGISPMTITIGILASLSLLARRHR
jgi:PKD repeat protein